jgi:hypothetical protein
MNNSETKINSFELIDFNLKGQIKLGGASGLIKLHRSEDGKLILTENFDYGLLDSEKVTLGSFAKSESILGFVLDIGIKKQKQLTFGGGFYFGLKLSHPQSQKVISQENFDESLFNDLNSKINTYYQSGEKHKEMEAIKMQLIIDAYNNARLMYPNFCSDSYLSLMRIIEATSSNRLNGISFAFFSATISPKSNQSIYEKIKAVYKDRIKIATDLFNECLLEAQKNKFNYVQEMSKFNEADKLVYSCFYSAYQYRNKFVHIGFPFPDVVKNAMGVEKDLGTAYLDLSLGISWIKVYRPIEGLKDGDSIDIHEIVGKEAKDFKEKYFLLLPTWYFMKRIVRESILKKLSSL